MLKRLFRPAPPTPTPAEDLYALAVAQARTPVFYTALGVPDRIDARFELYTLHVLLLIMRLREDGEEGGQLSQALFDTYVSALDNALRELGVGDISVGKKMRKLGEALYGRMGAYEAALAAGDAAVLSEALNRNVYEDAAPDGAAALADYALASRAALSAQPAADLRASPAWAIPQPPEAGAARP